MGAAPQSSMGSSVTAAEDKDVALIATMRTFLNDPPAKGTDSDTRRSPLEQAKKYSRATTSSNRILPAYPPALPLDDLDGMQFSPNVRTLLDFSISPDAAKPDKSARFRVVSEPDAAAWAKKRITHLPLTADAGSLNRSDARRAVSVARGGS